MHSVLILGVVAFAMSSVKLAAATTEMAADSLAGTIVDPGGKLVADATVSVTAESGAATLKTTVDSAGHFAFSGLSAGRYSLEVSAPGFGTVKRDGILVGGQQPELTLSLPLAAAADQVTVQADSSGSIAAALAPMDGLLEARSARTEISSAFVQNFASPVADSSELLQMAPGTFSVSSNGVGFGDTKTFFRGFPDGDYDITWDGIPFEDTNTPTHHSFAFFPSPWIGGIDFDRSPGSAATIGPAPFGGSINMLSRDLSPVADIRAGVTYASFNTILADFQYDSGSFGGPDKRANLFVDFNHLTTDGFQTFNSEERNSGSLKFQYKLTNKTTLTGFSGVLWLDDKSPNTKGPTRAQVAQFGYRYLLQNTDPTQYNYVKYDLNHIPTDFEYVGVQSALRHGWTMDIKPYTYSFNNQKDYAQNPKTGAINAINCVPVNGIQPCGVDVLNGYRKYGETSTVTQTSKYGIFRGGFWYEWATTDRHQIPQNPLTGKDDVLSNFNEQFQTNTYQPFGEYEYHPTSKLSVTGGMKYAHYTEDLTQHADNGTTVGNLGGRPSVSHSAGYNSFLPSVDANYRIKTDWSAYAQFATGSVIPPTSVFDTTGANTLVLPKPTDAKTYQTGSVLKLKRVTMNVDVYYTHFQNAYSASPDPNATSATQFTASGDSVSKGFEGETNLYLAHGLSLYANGTAGTAKFVSPTMNGVALPSYGQWVANAPANTEGLGLTWQQRAFDVGFFHKRVGPMWNDGVNAAGATLHEVIPIAPFDVDNVFVNYTVRSGSRLDGTKLRFSVNNLLNAENTTSVTQVAKVPTFMPGPGDTLGQLPGRSLSLTVTFGYSPKQ